MWIKNNIKKDFSDKKTLCKARYDSARFVFVITSFLFFVWFFFVSAWFYNEIFEKILSSLYIFLIISFDILVYLFLSNKVWEGFNIWFKILSIVLLTILSVIFMWPVIYDWGFVWLYNDFLS